MEQIGYSLIDANGVEVQHWGDVPGVSVGLPDLVRLPNGDHVHCPQVGVIQELELVPRVYTWAETPSDPTFDGASVVVTGRIADLKAKLTSQVDSDAESVRLRYITPGAGMAMTYAEKRDQANAVHEMGETAANALTEEERTEMFPTLAASVGLEAPTLWECASLVIQKAEAWATLSNVIERTRLAGKKAIGDASDAAAAQAAYEAITWPAA